jgi:hypothetical protein
MAYKKYVHYRKRHWKLLFIAISALRTFAMGFSHYQVWVLTNIWLKLLALSSWSRRKSPLVLAWKHLYSMVLHVPMQFLRHTNSLFLSTIYKYFSFPSFIPWSSTLFCWKEEVGRGESRNKNIYFHKTKSPLIKEKGITQVLVMFCQYIIFRGMPSYL